MSKVPDRPDLACSMQIVKMSSFSVTNTCSIK